jgi:hypothetical protein
MCIFSFQFYLLQELSLCCIQVVNSILFNTFQRISLDLHDHHKTIQLGQILELSPCHEMILFWHCFRSLTFFVKWKIHARNEIIQCK